MNNKIYVNGRFLTQRVTGVQRVASEISVLLQQHYKDQIVFVCPNQEIINPIASSLNIIKTGRFNGILWEQSELPFYLLKNKGNLLLNFSNTAPIIFSKNVIVVHDMAIKVDRKWFDWKFILLYKFLYFFNLKKALKIITVSNFSKDEIHKYYPDLNDSEVKVAHLASFMETTNLSDSKKNYFIAVNSINERKNIKVIVEAFKKLDPNLYKLKIVGELDEKVFGKQDLSAKPRNIEYLTHVSDKDLILLVQEAKALINSSLYEGFGLPPLEAMSLKTPCVLSRIPVYEELYSEVAFFFDPLNAEELKDKIIEMHNHKYYDLLCENSYQLSHRFSWQRTTQEYINCINEVLKNQL